MHPSLTILMLPFRFFFLINTTIFPEEKGLQVSGQDFFFLRSPAGVAW